MCSPRNDSALRSARVANQCQTIPRILKRVLIELHGKAVNKIIQNRFRRVTCPASNPQKNTKFAKINDAKYKNLQHSEKSQKVRVTPPRIRGVTETRASSIWKQVKFYQSGMEGPYQKQILNLVDPVELAKSWDVIPLRHLHRDRRWEVLPKVMSGYLNARIQRRRDSHQGYRPWTCDLW